VFSIRVIFYSPPPPNIVRSGVKLSALDGTVASNGLKVPASGSTSDKVIGREK